MTNVKTHKNYLQEIFSQAYLVNFVSKVSRNSFTFTKRKGKKNINCVGKLFGIITYHLDAYLHVFGWVLIIMVKSQHNLQIVFTVI